MNTAAKDKFDADISRITIVNEISPATTTIAAGENISAVYVGVESRYLTADYKVFGHGSGNMISVFVGRSRTNLHTSVGNYSANL